MPFGSEGLENITGLALSGGGFRATLFHCGTLWRLNEVGYLRKLDRISSVSGGSIAAGVLAFHWAKLSFTDDEATNFAAEIVNPLRDFCSRDIDIPAIGLGTLAPWKDISEVIEADYRKYLFKDMTLQQLPDQPRF